MFTYLLIAASLLAAIVLTLLHLPRWTTRPIMRIVPLWVQAVLVHAFGYLMGGVTGHVTGALVSMPYFFIARTLLRSRILDPTRD